MIKKKLQPLRKPANYNEISNNESVIVSCLTQMIQLQKRTIDLLEGNQITKKQAHPDKKSVPVTPQKVNESSFDHGNFQREKPLISLQGQLQKQQQLQFPQQDHVHALNGQNEQSLLMKNVLSQKLHNHDKKNYNVLNEFISHTDRREYKILVNFQSFVRQFPLISGFQVLEKLTIEWIGDVFRMVASMCWNMMLNGFLNYEETKILFTENIIYNYIQFMKALEMRGFTQYKHRLTSIINKKSVNILDFLGKQYPQTKIDAPNIHLKQILPKTNNSARMKFDVITIANRKGYELKYRENANYSVEIMKLINFIIDEINESYPEYEKECLHIFQQIFKLPDRRALAQDSDKNAITGKLVESRIDSTEDIMYKEKVKKYTKFLIGRKINKNVPKFTREEVNNGVFYPKSPSILRIITKWVQELTDVIKNPAEHILSADKQLKSHDGNFVVLFSKVRQGVCDKIIQNRDKLFKKIEGIKQECFYIESILSSPKYTEDSTQAHLSQEQISVGKFSVCVQKAISSYIFQQLNEILHFLLKIPHEVDESALDASDFHQSEIRKELNKLNLVTMKIFDLLRCKCISNEEEIVWIMNYLIDRNMVGEFKLVRVKDRLSEGTRDINCNIRLKKSGFLSEMQLSVVSNIQSKQEKLDSYNHFLYELKRSKLGPISENVSIWTVLQQRSLYFQKINKNPIPQKPTLHECSNENLQKFIRPICCESCNNFYPYPETVFSNVKCKKCKKTYCGQCYSIVLSNDDKKTMIFDGLFKQHVLAHIKQHSDPAQPFPLEGIYFKRYHQRRQLNYFTVLIKNSETQQPMSFESIKQIDSKQKEIECSIIFTHNAIRNDKTIEKQKNIDRVIRATIKNENEIYINKKDYEFFNQYLIFAFDKKFTVAYMTLEEIENFLKIEQNHSLKVLNIMEDPVYVDEIQYLKKKSEKLRELDRLKTIFKSTPSQRFMTYQFGKIFIVAKAYKDSLQLGYSINYANNVAQLKSHAFAQKSIVSMQKHNIKQEFNNLQFDINHKLAENLKKSLRKLYLNYNALQSLEGLKCFVLLEVLYVRHNNLVTLKGVEGMKDLILLRADDNKIEDLEPLRGLVGLKRLMGSDNKIKSLEPLSNLKLLKTIEFQKNQIVSLQPIKDLPDIQDLHFKMNPSLTTLPLFVSKRIISVSFSYTGITQFSTIAHYPKIYRLMLQDLSLTQIPPFINTMKLTQLWLGENNITTLSNLEDQYELQILSLKRNRLTSLKGVDILEKIKILYLDGNQVTSLQGVKPCFETLKHLSLKDNPLDDVRLIMYADQTIKFEYTREVIGEKARNFLDQMYASKVNSSGSED